jgi:hypothetical protein
MKFRKAMHAPLIQAAADGDWEMAQSIQITPSEFEGEREHVGVLIARPHATGWFISARCRRGLHAGELKHFQNFVARSAYLLLQEGPRPGTWAQGHSEQEWRAYAGHDSAGQEPEVIPSQWAETYAA